MLRATTSLPVPDSPKIITVDSDGRDALDQLADPGNGGADVRSGCGTARRCGRSVEAPLLRASRLIRLPAVLASAWLSCE
jgi:hypothetical protein